MALIVYATEEQLADWLDAIGKSLPDNDTGYRRSASIVVARACARQPYTDVPTDDEAGPLADATCAQVASWLALGVDPAKSGTDMPGPVKSSTILDAKVDRDTTAATARLADLCNEDLCDEAEAILLQAGLLYVPGPQFDSTGCLPSWGLDRPYGWFSPEFANSADAYSWPIG